MENSLNFKMAADFSRKRRQYKDDRPFNNTRPFFHLYPIRNVLVKNIFHKESLKNTLFYSCFTYEEIIFPEYMQMNLRPLLKKGCSNN